MRLDLYQTETARNRYIDMHQITALIKSPVGLD